MSSKTDQKNSPLNRYIAVLEAVAAAQAPLGLTEIAQVSDFPLGSAHRLVAGLLAANLVVAEGTTRKTYRLGPRLLRLLHAGTEAEKIRAAVQTTLETVADRLGETCYLARLSGTQVISIAWAVPERGVRGYVFPGDVMPPHAAASAKAIVAFQTPEFIDQVLARKLETFTPATRTSVPELRTEYERIRERRYAVCWDELEVGLAAVACPVEIPEVGVIYALGVAGMAERLSRRSVETVSEELKAVLPDVERALRHVSGLPRDPEGLRRGRRAEDPLPPPARTPRKRVAPAA
ncbi:IclR family transcriptional regulator C-terminal domain-containing protein [Enterovirga sp.]|uniref:IclR family transcriptional regulator n=1 Tax=Enterovirga sp. TaxID=2026350 RepID=UPI00260E3611|nr:IclR family transcriptional regulator C-terminal domain-containing protein [Enterovirga sp.]MDB5591186.1 srpS [Enterovirga sp.]